MRLGCRIRHASPIGKKKKKGKENTNKGTWMIKPKLIKLGS